MTFGQFIAILRARWKLAASLVAIVVIAAIAVSLLLPKRYSAVASVVVDAKPDPLSLVLNGGAMVSPSFMATQADIITSDRVALRVVRDLKLAQNPDVRQQWLDDTKGEGSIEQWLVDSLQKALDVKPSRDSNVINISYRAPDPRFAAGLANAFMQAYLRTLVELRVDPAKQYSGFFDARSKDAREALERTQTKLSDYQRSVGLTTNDERFDVETARLSDLSQQLVLLQAAAADSVSRQAQANGASADRLQEVLSNGVIAGLKSDLSRAEAHLRELSARYGDNHPQVQEAKASIAEIRSRLDAETRKVTSGVGVNNTINQQRVADMRAEVEAQRKKVMHLKEVRDQSTVLARDVENSQRAYDQVRAQLNQSSLESQANQTNVVVLNEATPPIEPSFPKLSLNILLAIFVGILLAVGAVLTMEMSDRRIRSLVDISGGLGMPLLGVLPKPTARRIFGRSSTTVMQQRLLGNVAATGKGA